MRRALLIALAVLLLAPLAPRPAQAAVAGVVPPGGAWLVGYCYARPPYLYVNGQRVKCLNGWFVCRIASGRQMLSITVPGHCAHTRQVAPLPGSTATVEV